MYIKSSNDNIDYSRNAKFTAPKYASIKEMKTVSAPSNHPKAHADSRG